MKRLSFFLALALLAILTASASDRPLWLRNCAISPDGTTIAFAYKGDIFTVPVTGGSATQITSNPAFDNYPVWSPDSKWIAFTSKREGSFNVWMVSRRGGTPKQLTRSTNGGVPVRWLDGGHVLYNTMGMPSEKSIIFPSSQFHQVFVVDTTGNRPKIWNETPMNSLDINAAGDVIYHDVKGYEDQMRKHHQSPITRDIWLYSKGSYRKLTDFKGEDRNPVWASDGKSFYYLSEADGTFNVWKRSLDGSQQTQLTHFAKNPVRFLSVAHNGTLCFGYDGELYTMKEGSDPQRISVSITTDSYDDQLIRQIYRNGATEVKVSPSGKEVAFVLHGDVYVTSVDYTTTKQVTDTPEQERSIDFAPDGRSIVYASERNGLWQIYKSTIKKSDEKLFTYATELEEEQLVKSDSTSFQPSYSPDGKSVAFLENRTTLRAVDVKSHKVRTLLDGRYNYSYSDGDVNFCWSPDSRWLLADYIGYGGWNNKDVALVPADGSGKVTNLTQSGYSDGNAKWVLGGKAMIFESDRAGFRSHGSWGSESDAYIMFFDLGAYEKFRMNKEDRARLEEQQKVEKDKKDKEPVDVSKKKEEPKPIVLALDTVNCRDRVIRLTVNSSRLGDFVLDPKGETLYYQAAFEGGYDLWKHDLKENRTQIVMKNVGGGEMVPDKDFKFLYLCSGGSIKQINASAGSQKNIDFEARFNYQPYKERAYLFDHVWRQVKDKLYDPNLQGVDWNYYRQEYEKFLPYINNNYDFSEMLSEMLGELNVSHTGARYYAPGPSFPTATLGLFYDSTYEGDGLRIKGILKGGPLTLIDSKVVPGTIIEAIDGEKILKNQDFSHMLDGKAGRKVRLTVKIPGKGESTDVIVKAISYGQQMDLLYKRWVERNRQLVDSLSHGQLAYVHVRAMDSESFRQVFSELLSDKNRRRKAVIVDERHNGGGWLHDDLCTLLSGKEYQRFMPRGRYVGYDPWNKWVKPSCVLMCEDDYSNGHGFPLTYKALGIGKLIGAPMAGTMTAVWWERLMDSSLVFGIPQVGCMDMEGHYAENKQLDPDIVVYNTPKDYLSGHDRQLERAVEEMMKN